MSLLLAIDIHPCKLLAGTGALSLMLCYARQRQPLNPWHERLSILPNPDQPHSIPVLRNRLLPSAVVPTHPDAIHL